MSMVYAEWVALCSEGSNAACRLAWGDDHDYREKRFENQSAALQALFAHLVRDHGLSQEDARARINGKQVTP